VYQLPLQIHRALSIRQDADSLELFFGINPPAAFRIRNPPAFLSSLITEWTKPHTIEEGLAAVAERFPHSSNAEIIGAIQDLISLGVLRGIDPPGRLDRHDLYFSLFGVSQAEHNDKLQKLHVGVVGTGGIGSTAALLLAAAGVGAVTASDGDCVEDTNLTRAVLFDEQDIGELKVLAAARKLRDHRRDLSFTAIPEQFSGPAFLHRNFGNCDILLLSADRPDAVYQWTNEAALQLRIPYISAGYSEVFGSVGPLVFPGRTACYKCNQLNGNETRENLTELNSSFQAPSYGPLNMIMAAISVNEILRFWLGLNPATLGRRIMIDSATYEMHSFELKANRECQCGAWKQIPESETLAQNYRKHREKDSLNRLVLDGPILRSIASKAPQEVLDIGCGIGTLSIELARLGSAVTSIDLSAEMLAEFRNRIPPELEHLITIIQGDAAEVAFGGSYDCILLNLILDYLSDPLPLLIRCRDLVRHGGCIFVVLPHPFKDSGYWNRIDTPLGWDYQEFRIRDYFDEGPIVKRREDDTGNIVVPAIHTYKRNLSTWAALFRSAGYRIDDIQEPRPNQSQFAQSANYSKASRVPYFLILECSPVPSKPEAEGTYGAPS
jgi:molybdopterin/thiamine biosynthesis adenylyltransferase